MDGAMLKEEIETS